MSNSQGLGPDPSGTERGKGRASSRTTLSDGGGTESPAPSPTGGRTPHEWNLGKSTYSGLRLEV